MTITPLEVEGPVVVESAEAITTTAEAEMGRVELAELLGEEAIGRLAAEVGAQAAEGGLKLLGSGVKSTRFFPPFELCTG